MSWNRLPQHFRENPRQTVTIKDVAAKMITIISKHKTVDSQRAEDSMALTATTFSVEDESTFLMASIPVANAFAV